MSGAAVAGAVVAAASIGGAMYSSHQQSKATRAAADKQAKASAQQLNQQQQEFNKANQNEVDISSILEDNSATSGMSTMLTGAGGIDRNKLALGGVPSLLGA